MAIKGMWLLLIGALSISACTTTRESPVGVRYYHFTDSSRHSWANTGPRPLETMVWYPAKKGTVETKNKVAIFETGWYARNAEFSDSTEKYPLILLSHGTGGSAASISWLAGILAENGFIVAAVNHHGNTGAEPKYLLQGFMLWWERPQDIKIVLDRLLEESFIGARIDTSKIGVAGFSIGGYTALAAAGARLEVERWGKYCVNNEKDPLCHLPPEADYTMDQVRDFLTTSPDVKESMKDSDDSFMDPRIRAAFVIAPVLGPIIKEESLRAISIPVRIVVGSKDDQGIPELNAIPFSKLIPNSTVEVLPDVTHYTFLAGGNFLGKIFAGKYLKDPRGIIREEVQRKVGNEAVAFFTESM